MAGKGDTRRNMGLERAEADYEVRRRIGLSDGLDGEINLGAAICGNVDYLRGLEVGIALRQSAHLSLVAAELRMIRDLLEVREEQESNEGASQEVLHKHSTESEAERCYDCCDSERQPK